MAANPSARAAVGGVLSAAVDIQQPEIRDRLRAVWLDPRSLDPSRDRQGHARSCRETRYAATLARNLELQYSPKAVASEFLTLCIFTSFAEDVNLLLKSLREDI